MQIVCLDLEGVLVPEIWIEVANRTGIDALRATTRDVPDYDALMRQRLDILAANGLCLADIQAAIDAMGPLDGAIGFLAWLRRRYQVVILSDTFYEFAQPLMRQLDWPTLFCHRLVIRDDAVVDYCLRLPDHKRETVKALQGLNFNVIASGDSYNDTGMLAAADAGFLFRPPRRIAEEFPDYPVAQDYATLQGYIETAAGHP
jgi:phosphoserine/homoserine phosphotransferase